MLVFHQPLSCGNVKFQELNFAVFCLVALFSHQNEFLKAVKKLPRKWLVAIAFLCCQLCRGKRIQPFDTNFDAHCVFINANSINKPWQLIHLMHHFTKQNSNHLSDRTVKLASKNSL